MNCFYCCTSIEESVEKSVEPGIVTLVGEDLSDIIEPDLETITNTEVNESLIVRENLTKSMVNEIQTNIPFVNEVVAPLKINIQLIK